MNDYTLGARHGQLGGNCKYPNNANYMRGFRAGTAWLVRQVALDQPFENTTPDGANDAHADCYYA